MPRRRVPCSPLQDLGHGSRCRRPLRRRAGRAGGQRRGRRSAGPRRGRGVGGAGCGRDRGRWVHQVLGEIDLGPAGRSPSSRCSDFTPPRPDATSGRELPAPPPRRNLLVYGLGARTGRGDEGRRAPRGPGDRPGDRPAVEAEPGSPARGRVDYVPSRVVSPVLDPAPVHTADLPVHDDADRGLRHRPRRSGVVIGSPCSGHGFLESSRRSVGRMLADLAEMPGPRSMADPRFASSSVLRDAGPARLARSPATQNVEAGRPAGPPVRR